jgi:branched-chain amino acid transport system substrate-binding protein
MKRTPTVLALAMAAALAVAACGGPGADTDDKEGPIPIGVLSDLSGATADVGTPYSEGIRGYVDWLNAKDGIEGRDIQLKLNDYAYDVAKAEQLYSQYVNEGVVAVQGWGTGDTEALRQKIGQDELPFMSASYAATLVDPGETPYNFVIASTYSEQMRVALKWIAEDAGGNAQVAVFHHDSPFGTSPVKDGEAYIKDKGLPLGYKAYPMARGATDFTGALSQARSQGAKYVVIQNVSSPAAVVAKNIKQQGLGMKVVCLNWCADELFIRLAGDAAEGHVMVQPFTPPSVDVPGHEDPANYLESKGQDLKDKGLHYVQGWYTMHVMAEGLRSLVKDDKEVTGANLKKALEEIDAVETGEVTPPIDFSDDSHEGMRGTSIYEVKAGTMAELAKAVQS